MKIRIFINAVMLFVLLCANSYAQSNNDSNAVNGDILKKRPLAFQFAIGENFTLENFSRYNISAKKHLSQNFALRFSLGLDFTDRNTSGTVMELMNYDQSQKYTSNFVSSEFDLILYVNPKDVVKAYIGIGPYFSYSDYTRDINYVSIPSLTQYDTYEHEDRTSYGASILFGAEWFFTDKFSLMTEYNFLFTYTDISLSVSSNSQGGAISSEQSGYQTDFQGESLRFGLSVYF